MTLAPDTAYQTTDELRRRRQSFRDDFRSLSKRAGRESEGSYEWRGLMELCHLVSEQVTALTREIIERTGSDI